jgi:predicted transcriptional regulator
MTTIAVKDLIERVAGWPPEDIAALEEFVREVENRRADLHRLTDDERAAIRQGLAQADRGEFVSDEEIAAMNKRHGI